MEYLSGSNLNSIPPNKNYAIQNCYVLQDIGELVTLEILTRFKFRFFGEKHSADLVFILLIFDSSLAAITIFWEIFLSKVLPEMTIFINFGRVF